MKRGLWEFLALWGVLVVIMTAAALLVAGMALAVTGSPFQGLALAALALGIISALAVSL